MKFFVFLIIVLLLSVTFTYAVSARALYFDYVANGDGALDFKGDNSTNGWRPDFKLNIYNLGLELPFDSTRLDFNCFYGFKKKPNVTISNLKAKAGLALLKTRHFRMDLTGGFFYNEIDLEKQISWVVQSPLAGIDAAYAFNKKIKAELIADYGVAPIHQINNIVSNQHSNEVALNSLFQVNLKLDWMLSKRFGIALGYRRDSLGIYDANQFIYSGCTAGCLFKF